MDEAIVGRVRLEHRLGGRVQTAEEIKLAIGSAAPLAQEEHVEIRDATFISGLPRAWCSAPTKCALRSRTREPDRCGCRLASSMARPELASDIVDRGIMLAGGGALFGASGERLRRRDAGCPVHVADSPLAWVVLGPGHSLEAGGALRKSASGAGGAEA